MSEWKSKIVGHDKVAPDQLICKCGCGDVVVKRWETLTGKTAELGQ